MSWYLANAKGIIDQAASVSGLADLREAADDTDLKDFFDTGETKEVAKCIAALEKLAESGEDEDVKSTAANMAKLMDGEKSVVLTQGFADGGDDDEEEDHHDPRPEA